MTITGWRFQDAVGNGFTVITLTENTMPLTNKGDTIILLNEQGAQVGPAFSCTREEALPGVEIVH